MKNLRVLKVEIEKNNSAPKREFSKLNSFIKSFVEKAEREYPQYTQEEKDQHWKTHSRIREELAEFINNENFLLLPKNDLISLLVLESSWRPLEPWKFLVRVSVLNEEK